VATIKDDIYNLILQHCHNGTNAKEATDKVAKLVEEKFTSTNKPSDASSCRIKYCQECGLDIRHEPAHVG